MTTNKTGSINLESLERVRAFVCLLLVLLRERIRTIHLYLCVSHARNSKFVRFRSISPGLERRFVVGIGAERRPTVFVMAR